MRTLTGFDAKADREGFLVAYPAGVGEQFNGFTCCGTQDDVGFVRAVATELISTWKADPDRVYLTGASNGADLSFRAAVEASGVFAAIAPVSGGFYGNAPDAPEYAPKTPVSVVTFIGLQDPMADTLRSGISVWQKRLKCRPGAATAMAGGAVRKTSATCANGSEVDVYQVKDGMHTWFGATTGDLADADPKINATDVIWDFFAAHPRQS
jgi:polyhydroxybutyrate depolymerase